MKMKMFYLACPYSSADDSERNARIFKFCQIDGRLMEAGHHTISPLYKHLLFENGVMMPSDWAYWAEYSKSLMALCDAVVVVCLDGWETSVGVKAEIVEAERLKKPLHYLRVRMNGENILAIRIAEDASSEADDAFAKAQHAANLQNYREAAFYQDEARRLQELEEAEAFVAFMGP